jgi:chaperone required for assembly of F1-ATPase
MRPALAGMKPALPKRFYKLAAVEERDGVFALTLDGRPARTPTRKPLAVSTPALGEALAAEWTAQGGEIDPSTMPITRIVNSTIDGVEPRRDEVIDDLVRYAGSDMLCYRAADPERLALAQEAAWRPVLDWVKDTHGARFTLAEGVMHVEQPAEALAAIRHAIEQVQSPFALAALHVMTTLSGSVLLALAHAQGGIDADAAWAAAHVDEIFQEGLWGEDYEAMERRRRRKADFDAASLVYRLAAKETPLAPVAPRTSAQE